jgi:hypothetical protein
MAERSKPLSTSSGFYRQSRVYMVMSEARRRNDSRLRTPWLKLRASSAALNFRRPSNLSSCRKLRGGCHCRNWRSGRRGSMIRFAAVSSKDFIRRDIRHRDVRIIGISVDRLGFRQTWIRTGPTAPLDGWYMSARTPPAPKRGVLAQNLKINVTAVGRDASGTSA